MKASWWILCAIAVLLVAAWFAARDTAPVPLPGVERRAGDSPPRPAVTSHEAPAHEERVFAAESAVDRGSVEPSPVDVAIAAHVDVHVHVDAEVVDVLRRFEACGFVVAPVEPSGASSTTKRQLPLVAGTTAAELEITSLAPARVRLSLQIPRTPLVVLEDVEVTWNATRRFGTAEVHVNVDDFLTGTVVAANGAGLAKSNVTMTWPNGSVHYWGRRGGEFLFRVPDAPAELVANYGSIRSEPVAVVPSAVRSPLTIRIDTSKVIGVRLTDDRGAPVREYRIDRSFFRDESGDSDLQLSVDGVLFLKNTFLPAGTRLYVRGPEFSFSVDLATDWVAGTTYPLRVSDEAKARVSVTGLPQTHVLVALNEVEVPDPKLRVPRNYSAGGVSDGHAEFPGVAYGVYDVLVRDVSGVLLRRTVQVYSPYVTVDLCAK